MTLLKPKFNYVPLKRIETKEGRRYVKDGDVVAPVPSVTSILSDTGDKTALIEWRKRVGDEEANRISRESAGLGTKVHDALEKYVLGAEWDTFGTNMISVLAKSMTEVMINKGMNNITEVWGLEVGLMADGLYAGTSDCIGKHQDVEAIIDYKTAKKIKKKEWIEDYFLQSCAYALAHNETYGTNIRRAAILMVDRNLDFQEYVIEGNEFDDYCVEWGNRVIQYYDRIK